jgi:hypothetical protein
MKKNLTNKLKAFGGVLFGCALCGLATGVQPLEWHHLMLFCSTFL